MNHHCFGVHTGIIRYAGIFGLGIWFCCFFGVWVLASSVFFSQELEACLSEGIQGVGRSRRRVLAV